MYFKKQSKGFLQKSLINSFNKTNSYHTDSSQVHMKKKQRVKKALQIAPHVQIYLLWEVGFCSEACAKSHTGRGPNSPEKKDCPPYVPKCMQETGENKEKSILHYCSSDEHLECYFK